MPHPHSVVAAAIKRGELPSLRNGSIRCVDCGAVATCYDHRDYAEPLKVDPVCHACNLKRGPAKNPIVLGPSVKLNVSVRLSEGMLSRIFQVMEPDESTSEFIRAAILRELIRRERNGTN